MSSEEGAIRLWLAGVLVLYAFYVLVRVWSRSWPLRRLWPPPSGPPLRRALADRVAYSFFILCIAAVCVGYLLAVHF